MDLQTVLRKMKRVLRPDETRLAEIVDTLRVLNESLKKKGIKAVAVQGGSTAKGTFLKGDHDVDIFVRFGLSYDSDGLSDLLEKALPFKAERVHGSRDYFHCHDGFKYEIVPVLAVKHAGQAKNVTDMSPLHVQWVKRHLKNHPRLADEIRLAKRFCKAQGVYGAESYIKGFSGHILDILVIHYGSFTKLLKASVAWKVPVVIDPEKQLKKPLEELNPAKVQAPLVLVDPLQKDRNAAAALSHERFFAFQKAAARFLQRPSLSAFAVTPKTKKDYRPRAKTVAFFLDITPLSGKDDVVGAKLLKAFEYVKRQVIDHGFSLVKADWQFGTESFFVFYVKKETLSEKETQMGPPLSSKTHAAAFKKKHPNHVTRHGRLFAKVKRPYRTPRRLMDRLVKDPFVARRVKDVRLEVLHGG